MSKIPNYDPAEHAPRLEDFFLSRRQWLQRTGMGMGALTLATMLGNIATQTACAAGAEEGASAGQGKACDPHLCRGRPVACRYLGSQANAGQIFGPDVARSQWAGLRVPLQVHEARQIGN